jgi:hypothetical protein
MNTSNKTTERDEAKISVKMKLSALWITLMLLYIYADIFHLFMPGRITNIVNGQMGPFSVTQWSLFSATILMMIPAVMVFLSLTLKSKVNRWVNIILGALYTFVNISNVIGETWVFYISFVIAEIVLTCLIIGYAIKWRNLEE